jgi:hypothetical protein
MQLMKQMHTVQSFVVVQGFGGIGFFHLNVPSGGVANGIPYFER